MEDMSHTRVRTVVNIYDLDMMDDEFVEDNFNKVVNAAIREIEENDGEVVTVMPSHHVVDGKFVMTVTLEYGIDSPVDYEDDEDEDEVPELGAHPRKVTREVFEFVKRKAGEDFTQAEIADLFDGELSSYTVSKILKTDDFEDYYVIR